MTAGANDGNDPGTQLFGNGGGGSKPAVHRRLVGSALFHRGPASRVGLSRATGLPHSRLTEICRDLIREGIVREASREEPEGRGRPETLLRVDLAALGVACVRYDAGRIVAAAADLAGTLRWQKAWEGPFRGGASGLLDRVERALGAALAAARTEGIRILAVGAADPGTVNRAAGRSVRATHVPGWENVPVVDRLRRFAKLPVLLERGDGWQALGEVAFGAGRGARSIVFVTLLDGIGGGIVDEGRLLAGRDGSAGEIGHVRVEDGGPACGCGGRGCLEACVAPARLAALWKPGGRASAFPALLRAARDGDARAREILAGAGRSLARAVGAAATLLNPERVLLGGGFVDAGDLILAPMREALPALTLAESLRNLEVRAAELGETSTFLGMIAAVRERVFARPGTAGPFVETAPGKESAA